MISMRCKHPSAEVDQHGKLLHRGSTVSPLWAAEHFSLAFEADSRRAAAITCPAEMQHEEGHAYQESYKGTAPHVSTILSCTASITEPVRLRRQQQSAAHLHLHL